MTSHMPSFVEVRPDGGAAFDGLSFDGVPFALIGSGCSWLEVYEVSHNNCSCNNEFVFRMRDLRSRVRSCVPHARGHT